MTQGAEPAPGGQVRGRHATSWYADVLTAAQMMSWKIDNTDPVVVVLVCRCRRGLIFVLNKTGPPLAPMGDMIQAILDEDCEERMP